MSEDWDLFAVVRSCSSSATSNTQDNRDGKSINELENPLSCLAGFRFDEKEEEGNGFLFPSFVEQQEEQQPPARTDLESSSSCNELQDSYKPFLQNPNFSVSIPKIPNFVQKQERIKEEEEERKLCDSRTSLSSPTTSASPVFVFRGQRDEQQLQIPVRSRKRKNQQKRTICHVTQENLSSDLWAWRKYGQKPIKGSPYPRNYYRCSSSKGCLARKQVERSNLDPNIFIVTYTGEHTHPRPTHRNSLAGSTRTKQQSGNPKPDPGEHLRSDPNLSPTTPLKENDDVQATQSGTVQENLMICGEEEEDEEEDEDDDGILIPNLQSLSDPEGFFGLATGDFQLWTAGNSAAVGSAASDGGGGG